MLYLIRAFVVPSHIDLLISSCIKFTARAVSKRLPLEFHETKTGEWLISMRPPSDPIRTDININFRWVMRLLYDGTGSKWGGAAITGQEIHGLLEREVLVPDSGWVAFRQSRANCSSLILLDLQVSSLSHVNINSTLGVVNKISWREQSTLWRRSRRTNRKANSDILSFSQTLFRGQGEH